MELKDIFFIFITAALLFFLLIFCLTNMFTRVKKDSNFYELDESISSNAYFYEE